MCKPPGPSRRKKQLAECTAESTGKPSKPPKKGASQLRVRTEMPPHTRDHRQRKEHRARRTRSALLRHTRRAHGPQRPSRGKRLAAPRQEKSLASRWHAAEIQRKKARGPAPSRMQRSGGSAYLDVLVHVGGLSGQRRQPAHGCTDRGAAAAREKRRVRRGRGRATGSRGTAHV